MNTPGATPSTAAAGHASTSQAHGTAGKERLSGGRPAATGDLFAQLLLLLSAGTDATSATQTTTADGLSGGMPGEQSRTGEPAQPLVADTTAAPTHPLLHLLGWSATPAPLPPSPQGTGAGGGNTTPGSAAAAPGLLGAATGPASPQAGQQAWATPETLDADTLVAMGLPTPAAAAAAGGAPNGGTGGSPAPGTAQARHLGDGRAPLGVHVTAWRSTTTLAHAASSHGAVSGMAGADRNATSLTGPHLKSLHGIPLQPDPRSATAPDSTPADTDAAPSLAGAASRPHTPGEPGALPTDAGAAAAGQGGDGNPREPAAGDGHSPDEAQPSSPYGTQAEADEAGSMPWGAQHLRHASLRVGDAGDGTIDIQLSMAGQELQVAFRTDDEQTRAQLAQDAGNALGELLQRSGIELGGVSVGGQGAHSGQQQAGHTPQPPHGPRSEAAASRPPAADAAVRSAATPRPRADGSQALDLFA